MIIFKILIESSQTCHVKTSKNNIFLFIPKKVNYQITMWFHQQSYQTQLRIYNRYYEYLRSKGWDIFIAILVIMS